MAGQASAQQASLPALTRVPQIRRLTPDQAALGYPVRLRAVVTYYDPQAPDLFIQDSTEGIRVETTGASLALKPGELIEAEGVTGVPAFAPQLEKARIRVLGHAPMPRARQVSYEQMASSAEDSQWVEVEGVVRSATKSERRLTLDLAMEGGHLRVFIAEFRGPIPPKLVDSKLKIRGVCGTHFNRRNQLIGVALYVLGLTEVKTEEEGPVDPFASPARPIGSLLRFTPEGAWGHRVRVQGVVTLQLGGSFLFIQDQTQGLYVQTKETSSVQPGDRVDVLGFPSGGAYAPVLQDAVFRKTSSGPPPEPSRITAFEALEGPHHAELVQMEARLLDRALREGDQLLVLQAGNTLFSAHLEKAEDEKKLASLRPGSLLQLTGICSVEVDEDLQPRAFRLLLRSAQDVVVLERPPWWTIRHVLWTLGVMGGIILAALAWVTALRRQVGEQTSRIREWLRREASLKEQYHELFENANDVVFTLDLEGKFTSLNKAGEEITGYTRHRVLETNFAQIVAPEYGELARKMLESQRTGEGPGTYELEVVAKDGRKVPLEVSTRLIDRDGKPVAVQGIARDMTERKRVQEALRDSEERFRKLFDEAPVAYHEIDTQGVVRRMNQAECKLLGFHPSEMLGKYVWEFVAEDEREISREAVRLKVSGEQPQAPFQRQYIRRDGTRLIVEIHENLMRDKAGSVVGVRSAMLDVTERKRAEEALRTSEERYRLLFERNLAGVYRTTTDGRILDCNEAFVRMLGYASHEQVLALSKRDFYTDPADWEVFLAQLRQHKTLTNFENLHHRRDGRIVWVLENVSLREGDVIEGTCVDITERKQADKALQEANEKLTRWANELQARNLETSLLNEMGGLLQTCLAEKEAYAVVGQYAEKLFPSESGALYIRSASRDFVEAVAVWGDGLHGEQVFALNECWALRSSRLHFVDSAASGLFCQHVTQSPPATYLCVPMMAQGDTVGVLHVRNGPHGQSQADGGVREHLMDSKQQLAASVAEHVALALANLKLRETLRLQSIRDPLTGVFNRRYMEESLDRELCRAARAQKPLAAIMLDIDNFKQYNDTFGHEAGDAVLRELGYFLQKHVRGSDIVCRYGGEEFTLILPEATLEGTLCRAEQLREGIKHLDVQHRGQRLTLITLSLGVAVFPEHGKTAETLLRAADAALYRAKAEGRDRVVLGQAIASESRS